MLEIESIKRSVLVDGVNEHEIKFDDMDRLVNAVNVVNLYETESNEFLKDSYLVGKTKAETFISNWKINHSKKIQLIIEEKQTKIKEQLKKTQSALKLIPTLQKQHKEFIATINEMMSLDKYSVKEAYSYGSPYRRDTEDILKELQYIIDNTVKASKGAK